MNEPPKGTFCLQKNHFGFITCKQCKIEVPSKNAERSMRARKNKETGLKHLDEGIESTYC
jgi:hypothetical protein